MPQIFYWNRTIAREGDGVTRKVKRVTIKIDNHLYLMRRRSFGGVLERMRRGHDVDLAIGTQLVHEAIKQCRFEERFVPLDIDNEIELLRFPGDLSDAISPAVMVL